MHRLLSLFRLLRIVTLDTLRIGQFYVTSVIGWLDSFFSIPFQHHWELLVNGAFGNLFKPSAQMAA